MPDQAGVARFVSFAPMTTVGEALISLLEAHGVDKIFCVPGESYLGLTDALTDVPSIGLVVCRHEGGGRHERPARGIRRDAINGTAKECRDGKPGDLAQDVP